MLLNGDVTNNVQKRGSTPRHARPETGFAFEGPFSTQFLRDMFDRRKSGQTRRFCNMEETAGKRWMLIEAETRIGCARSGSPSNQGLRLIHETCSI
jgi:hypothetical protein